MGGLACAAAVAYVIRHRARPCAAVVPVGRREPPFYERNAVAPNRGGELVPREHRRVSPMATNGSSRRADGTIFASIEPTILSAEKLPRSSRIRPASAVWILPSATLWSAQSPASPARRQPNWGECQ